MEMPEEDLESTERKSPEVTDIFRSVWRPIIAMFAFFLLTFLYFPFASWCNISSFGMWFQLAVSLFKLVYFALCFSLIFIVLISYRNFPFISMYFAALILIFIFPMVGFALTIDWQRSIQISGLQKLSERTQPLVQAIHQYEEVKGAPPEALASLIPEFISEIPSTGFMEYGELEYHKHDPGFNGIYLDNAWSLSLHSPLIMLNFDTMLYLPKQNYPEKAHGYSYEPVGDWAYVHE